MFVNILFLANTVNRHAVNVRSIRRSVIEDNRAVVRENNGVLPCLKINVEGCGFNGIPAVSVAAPEILQFAACINGNISFDKVDVVAVDSAFIVVGISNGHTVVTRLGHVDCESRFAAFG